MDFSKLEPIKNKLKTCDVTLFKDVNGSFAKFVNKIHVSRFRHIQNLTLEFGYPVTVVAGTNAIGKTSLLLLLACSHEKFMHFDAVKPEPTWRAHIWRDMFKFTLHETQSNDYSYTLSWRFGNKVKNGEGKRLVSRNAWSGLGKSSRDDRTNAKIKDRDVRLIDLDRLLPARSFSSSLLRKTNTTRSVEVSPDVRDAFCYVLGIPRAGIELHEVGKHVNKRCYLIKSASGNYSSYGAATGEESLINLLREAIEAPVGSLILIDEVEAGFHPAIQRRLIEAIQIIAWTHKKQFILTSHSATVIDALPPEARRFVERRDSIYLTLNEISPQAALSKMDTIGHPLVRLYCEDSLAKFLITKVLQEIARERSRFDSIFEIVSVAGDQAVKQNFNNHQAFFNQLRNKIGYCAVLDGDCKGNPEFTCFDDNDFVHFMIPSDPPEVFLVKAYLDQYPNQDLKAKLGVVNHHSLFGEMVEAGLASDNSDARSICYNAFVVSDGFAEFCSQMSTFLNRVVMHFEKSLKAEGFPSA